ncbi:protoporphyrinogen/coproporphyrinogen oxidase [Sorangium sp. So ce1153]|uniref:protoporphyrinogen/coproporphyrinogen oxidase n=1 Tax=Sorangium sp. So ce1153 TaxID=3133333 RepID=UPI003F63A906
MPVRPTSPRGPAAPDTPRPDHLGCRARRSLLSGAALCTRRRRRPPRTRADSSGDRGSWYRSAMRRIAIVGGGLAGCIVAFRRAAAGDEVTLVEAAPRLGGQLWTERASGFVVEHGAEGFIARSEAVPALAGALGIAGDLVGQETQRSFGFDGAALRELAPGEAAAFLGFQVPRDELGRGIRTFRLGMAQLTDTLAAALAAGGRADVRVSAAVTSLAREAGGLRLSLADGGEVAADAVVIATGAAGAAALLGEPARAIHGAETLSSVTVSLAYPRAAIEHPLDGTGFVVAAGHQAHGFRACTFTTSKFAARAPASHVALRLFFRPEPGDLEQLDDAAWTARAEASLARVLSVRGAAERAWVSRWSSALPVSTPAHAARVREVEQALAGSGVLLAGSAFHGSGIDAAVRSAEAAAERAGAL